MSRILVIRLGALGDVIQGLGPFAAIRAHHPGAHITLLTTPPYAALLRRAPWFDAIWEDGRPRTWRGLASLARRLAGAGFGRVYDLQTSNRSDWYRALLPRAEWSGTAWGASHRHPRSEARRALHTIDRQRVQLGIAGITDVPAPDLGWLAEDVSGLGLPPAYALLVPGASPHRPGKRWPTACFARFAVEASLPCVILGGPPEAGIAAEIRAAAPRAIDLTGRTSLPAIASLARGAAFALGNDTGPTHLVAATGCPTLALFGADSDPALCAPRGPATEVLRHIPLGELTVAQVAAAVSALPPRCAPPH
jgi:ADP-heptose:LPS heptosyltransferase